VFAQAVDIFLCAGEPLVGQPSTVVDLVSEPGRVIRVGAVPEDEVADALRGVG
jgi:tRNA A37 threonylcarbamoyladenosine synthetase subunit TsaC/SUA5/YrdC